MRLLGTCILPAIAGDGHAQHAMKGSLAECNHLQSALTSALTETACELRKNVNYSAISSLVTEALEGVLGLREPQLVQVLRVTPLCGVPG